MDLPFPNKPVIHRRSSQTQGPFISHEFEKVTLSHQQSGNISSKDCHSNSIQETTGLLYSREDSDRLSNRELQMARAIHEKELMLQGKLWKVGEKTRQIQTQSADTAANDQHRDGEERQCRTQVEKGKFQTKTELFECEKKQTDRSRDTVEESRHCNFKQKINKQVRRIDVRMKNNSEVQQARWEGAEMLQSKDERPQGVHVIHEEKMNGVPNNTRMQETNNYSRIKGGDLKGHGIWKMGEINNSKQHEPSLNNTDWTKEKDYKERADRRTYNVQQVMPQKILQKSAHTQGFKNHERRGGKLSEESTLPLVSSSSHSSQQKQADEALISIPDDNHQLLPCSFCNRTFRSERLEKHTQICKNVKSQRQVYNSSFHRSKGSQIEEFFKTHTRSKTPEILKRKKNR